MSVRRWALATVAGMAALVSTQAGASVQVIANSYSPDGIYGGINIASQNASFGGSAGRFDVTAIDTQTQEILRYSSFCIDALVGFGTYVNYVDSPLSAGFSDIAKRQHVAALLLSGNPLINSATSVQEAREIAAALALATWEIVYEPAGSTSYDVSAGNFSVFGDFTPLIGRANLYLSNAVTGAWTGNPDGLRTLISVNGQSQNQVYIAAAAPAVPEPATWAMMIVGFGLIGHAMRNAARRKPTVAVTYG